MEVTMDYNIKDVSGRLKGTREYLDITVEDMAKKTNVSTEEYISLENGEKVLTCSECGQTKTVTVPALIIPQTGDNSNIALWLTVLAVSGIGTGAVVCTKKKSEEN